MPHGRPEYAAFEMLKSFEEFLQARNRQTFEPFTVAFKLHVPLTQPKSLTG